MDLRNAEIGVEYIVREIVTGDEEMDAFLFTLALTVFLLQLISLRLPLEWLPVFFQCSFWPDCSVPLSPV